MSDRSILISTGQFECQNVISTTIQNVEKQQIDDFLTVHSKIKLIPNTKAFRIPNK